MGDGIADQHPSLRRIASSALPAHSDVREAHYFCHPPYSKCLFCREAISPIGDIIDVIEIPYSIE
jgi:hypothetical protein